MLAAAPWLAAVAGWAGTPPMPITLLAGPAEPAPDRSALAALLAAGLTGWWPATLLQADAAAALASAPQLDVLRWQADQGLRAVLADSRSALDERLWVDRAKGLLMQAGRAAPALREEQAIAMLRGAAMHAKLRLAELSRAVVEASSWAEAINRAGQLRMLSQRLVKLAAQRLAGVDAPGALAHQQAAAARVVDNLLFLDRLKSPLGQPQTPGWAADLQQVHAAWSPLQALQALLAQRPGCARLAQADVLASQLLAAAEALAAALQTSGGRPALQIVNQCGRQRMLVQRLAKEALLAALLAEPARQAALPALVLAVDAGLTALAGSALSSPEIRTLLDDARQQWQRLCAVLRRGAGADGLAVLVHTSDALADRLDQLTEAYEHSLQVIMS